MPRGARSWTSEISGSFHIISRIAGGERLLGDQEKEFFLLLLEKFSRGFFVDIHAFCILSNHFHILATERNQAAQEASRKELIQRYQGMYGHENLPPQGAFDRDGTVIPDRDDGLDRLRTRLGSISRFTQELKQSFSRWYNQRSGRKGYLWADRFKGVIVSLGEAQLACSAYIDLNPIRAGIVRKPEEYRWSSIGLKSRDPRRANRLLTPISYDPLRGPQGSSWYRLFVYSAGGISKRGHASISEEKIREVQALVGELGLKDKLKYRLRNLSEGYAFGNKELIEQVQKMNKRKYINARKLSEGSNLHTTRVLKS